METDQLILPAEVQNLFIQVIEYIVLTLALLGYVNFSARAIRTTSESGTAALSITFGIVDSPSRAIVHAATFGVHLVSTHG